MATENKREEKKQREEKKHSIAKEPYKSANAVTKDEQLGKKY